MFVCSISSNCFIDLSILRLEVSQGQQQELLSFVGWLVGIPPSTYRSVAYSFIQTYLLSMYYVSGTVLSAGDTAGGKNQKKFPALLKLTFEC